MTDDTVFDGWYNRRFSNRESDDCGHGREDMLEAWQAATTALLEKLKSEGMVEKATAAAIKAYDKRTVGPDCMVQPMYKAARAVIEALEKELVG